MHLFIWTSRVVALLLIASASHAATIIGDITDRDTKLPIAGVIIQNIHSGRSLITDSTGSFSIEGNGDDLIEFVKEGFETARFRIPKGQVPGYFKIILFKTAAPLPTYEGDGLYDAYVKDSIKYHELYQSALRFEKLTGVGMIQHPFSALSKRNRQIWAFQKEYAYFQKEKFVDWVFSVPTVSMVTGLQGDSLSYFMRRFRPTYEQVHSMTEYDFYQYIRQNAVFYRTGIRPNYKPNHGRNSE